MKMRNEKCRLSLKYISLLKEIIHNKLTVSSELSDCVVCAVGIDGMYN